MRPRPGIRKHASACLMRSARSNSRKRERRLFAALPVAKGRSRPSGKRGVGRFGAPPASPSKGRSVRLMTVLKHWAKQDVLADYAHRTLRHAYSAAGKEPG